MIPFYYDPEGPQGPLSGQQRRQKRQLMKIAQFGISPVRQPMQNSMNLTGKVGAVLSQISNIVLKNYNE